MTDVRRLLPLATALLLTAIQATLLVATARDKSDTVDEDIYLSAAAILWAHRDFDVNPDSPVLPKWAFALAMSRVEPTLDRTPRGLALAENYVFWYGGRPRIERILLAARLTTIAVTTLFGLLLWRVALRFGAAGGFVTHALWCFSPAVLAAGSLATLDAWVTAMVVGLTWGTVRYLESSTWPRAVAVGVFGGLALGCKVTALGALGVAGLACAWGARRAARDRGRPWVPHTMRVLAALTAAAVVTLWVVYGLSTGRVSPAGLDGLPASIAAALPPLPFPSWIKGVLAQWNHGTRGHRGYLFGQTSLDGWWWFYLAALVLKTTIGAQVLAVMLLVARIVRPRGKALLVDAALLAYPILLIGVMSAGRTQLGIRYILPAFPGAMLWAGWTFPMLGSLGAWARLAGALALLAGTAEALRVHPHHLMFFNAWIGGPERGPQCLVTGDCIGQDQRRLADWQAERGIPSIYYTWYSGRPEYWGVAYDDPPCQPHAGVYALEAIEVHRPRRIAPGCLDWILVEPPDERIGYSIYVYHVTRERAARLRSVTSRVPFWRQP